MSEEALQVIWQAKMISENLRDSFGRKLSEDILDKMLSELQQFDEASKDNHIICGEVSERIQQSEDLAAEAGRMED